MSSNISGFQGVKTPLQSMTNGKYTLADYTNMNTVFGARITALEKAVAFNPNNVTIGGYLNVQPNSTNPGNLSINNNALVSGALQVNKTATINQNLNVGGNLAVSGAISFVSTNINTLNSNTINNTGTITSGTFVGNGSALTSLPSDATKLSTSGGTMTGPLTIGGNLIVNAGYTITGNGVGLTNIDDINKLPLTGGIISSNLTVNGIISGNGSGLTNIPTSQNSTTATTATTALSCSGNSATATTAGACTGNAATATTALACSGTAQNAVTANTCTGNSATASTATNALACSGNAATATSATDNTKLPTAGGTMTGSLTMNAPGAFIGNGSLLSTCFYYSIDQLVTTYVLPAQDVKNYQVGLNYQNNCTLQLVNLSSNTASFNDKSRYLTITKIGKPAGDFTVTLTIPPVGYTFFTSTTQNAASIIMPLGVFSYTFLINYSGINGRIILISQV